MRSTRLVVAASIAVIVAAPAFAAAKNPAASLSLANGKSDAAATTTAAQSSDDGSATAHKAHAGNHSGTLALAGLGAAAVVGGAVALGTSGHDDMPASN